MVELFIVQINALAATFAFGVSIFLLLHTTVGERWAIVAFLNDTALLLLLGNVMAFTVLWALGAPWLWRLYGVPGVVMLVLWYGRLFIPKGMSSYQDRAITVATYNIETINDFFDKRLAVVKALDADIIGLQESWGWHVACPQLDGYYRISGHGFNLLTRFPYIPEETVLIGVTKGRSMPVGLRTVLLIAGLYVSVYVVHPKRPQINIRPLIYNGNERTAGVNDLVWMVEHENNPVIMIGDCNMGFRSEDYRQLRKHLVDSWRQRGWGLGLTAPAQQTDTPLRLLRSDMIWHSSDIQTHAIRVWPDAGKSDHYPLCATLNLPLS